MRNKIQRKAWVIILVMMVSVLLGVSSGSFMISTVYAAEEGVAPTVRYVIVPSNYTYTVGSSLDFSVSFSEAITVTGTPRLAITIGSTTVGANYISGSGTSTLVFRYTIKAGDQDSDGITVGALSLNGGTIKNAAGNDADLTLNSVASTLGVKVDGVVPTVTSVSVPPNGTYKIKDNIDFTVNFSEEVTVIGTPRLAITIGSTTVYADYVSGSGTSALVFRYTIKAGDQDSDGVTVGALSLNGSTIRDVATNNALLTLNSVASTSGVKVDGVVPTVTSVSVPPNGTYKIEDNIDFTVNFSEAVTVTGTPRLAITIGSTMVYADYVSGSGTSALVFQYTIKTGDQDSDGITVGALSLNGATIKNAAGNDAILTLNSIASTLGVKVDGVVPTVTSVSVPPNGTYKIEDNIDFTVNFSEEATVTGTPRLAITIGSTTVGANYISGSGTSTLVFRYTIKPGDQDIDGITVGALSLNGGTIRDAADNDAVLTLNSIASTLGVKVDGVVPTVTSVSVPPNGTYKIEDNIDFTINFSEEATVTGTPRLAITIGSTTVYTDYVRGSGTSALVFQYTIKAGDQDSDGITVGALSLNGGTIKNAAGNDAVLTLNSIASTLGVKVGEAAPSVIPPPSSSISTPEGKIEKDQKRNENAPVASLNDSSEELKSKLLSTEEQAQVATGKDAKVILKIEEISATVSEEDKKKIKEKLTTKQQNTADIATLYIDISLYKQIGEGEESKITKTNGKISISLEVPENMQNTKEGTERTYHVIRIHDGVAELLEGSYDPISHLFTFETDLFSVYALAYLDVNTTANQVEEGASDKITVYNDFYHLRLKAKADKTSQKLSYAKVSDADGYLIYGAQCGKDMKLLAEVGGDITSYTVKKLKQSTYYKYQLKAYKIIDGEKVILATSKLVRSVTTSKTYGNPTKITSSISSVTLAVGKTKKVTYEVVLPENKKMKDYASQTRFETTNKKIATISSSGKITAKSKGTCYVYVYAQNGVNKKIKVTVK